MNNSENVNNSQNINNSEHYQCYQDIKNPQNINSFPSIKNIQSFNKYQIFNESQIIKNSQPNGINDYVVFKFCPNADLEFSSSQDDLKSSAQIHSEMNPSTAKNWGEFRQLYLKKDHQRMIDCSFNPIAEKLSHPKRRRRRVCKLEVILEQ